MEERLQKIISKSGIASRRAAEALIKEKRITINGTVVTELGIKVDAMRCTIAVDGRIIAQEEEHVYLLLNKPKAYLSTAKDDRGRRTVLDLVPGIALRIYPVGRLDYNTTGLLLLTNDGALTNGLLHPKQEVEKTYVATVKGRIDETALQRLRTGISLEDGVTAPAKVRMLERTNGLTKIEVIIHEGRNRQVRRMFAAVGCDVRALMRTNFAGLSLDGVKCGAYRLLTKGEVDRLRLLAGLLR